jgi:hypothetical protein
LAQDDRLLLDWSGKALTIERAAEGGVKPKAIGKASVVLPSWKLGNLNLDQPKVSGANASGEEQQQDSLMVRQQATVTKALLVSV